MSLVKTVKKYGNSGGVYVPRRWIGGRVRVKLLEEPLDPRKDLLKLLPMEHVITAILYGSYVRKEAAEGSDVDVLVVVDDDADTAVPEELKRKYDIQVKKARDVRNAAARDPVFYKILKDEAVAIVNHQFLEGLKRDAPSKRHIAARISLLESSMAIIKGMMETGVDSPDMAYPLMMRLKEIVLIECLLSGRRYSSRMLEGEILSRGIEKAELSALMGIYRAARNGKNAPGQKLEKDTAAKLVAMLEEKIKYVRQKTCKERYRVS